MVSRCEVCGNRAGLLRCPACDDRCPRCQGDPAAGGGVCPLCGALPVVAVEVWEDDGGVEPAGLGGCDLGGEG